MTYISYILVQPDDGPLVQKRLLNLHWNKQLLCLTGFTMILIIHNTTGMNRLKIITCVLFETVIHSEVYFPSFRYRQHD
jgi:hypothetical protein